MSFGAKKTSDTSSSDPKPTFEPIDRRRDNNNARLTRPSTDGAVKDRKSAALIGSTFEEGERGQDRRSRPY